MTKALTKTQSMEDLRNRTTQLEATLSKFNEELAEIAKKQEFHARLMDEGSRKVEEGFVHMANQLKEANKGTDEKFQLVSDMLGKLLRQVNGKEIMDSSAGPCGAWWGSQHRRRSGRRSRKWETYFWTGLNANGETFSEWHYEDGEFMLGGRRNTNERGNNRGREGNSHFQLPRMDFPYFDGGDPIMWQINCKFFFGMYVVPEEYKVRLAVMNFSEEYHEWYRGLVGAGPQLQWGELIEEIKELSKGTNTKHPLDEFKRIHQIGKVEEYVKRFRRARSRVLQVKPNLDEEFFIIGFISGLKEDVRNQVELFEPTTLNKAYQCALKVEVSLDSQARRPREAPKIQKFQKFSPLTKKSEAEKKEMPAQKPWPPLKTTYEERKALGLCHKCEEKYFPGHKCASKFMNLEGEGEEENDEEGIEKPDGEVAAKEEEEEQVKEAVISMFNNDDKKVVSAMKFRGQIKNTPICALLDSGSTHSFLNPEAIEGLSLTVQDTIPMVVRVANGAKMVTDTVCKSLNFSLQGHPLVKDMRLLAIQGYDMILGLDWLTSLGPMLIDWGKGTLEFKVADQNVLLQVRKESQNSVIEGRVRY